MIDTTVATIVLVGEYAHRSRWIDWEIRVSLESGEMRQPNTLIGILLDDEEKLKDRIPARLLLNARFLSEAQTIPEDRYGLILPYPNSYGVMSQVMRNLLVARAERARLIRNPRRVLVE